MVSLERMAALEANSEWRGVTRPHLMENAGAKVVEEIWKHWTPEESAAIFAGTGNNGGDGFVAARRLVNRGIDVTLVLIGRPRNISSGEAENNWKVLTDMEEDISFRVIRDSKEIENLDLNAEVVIDALLGTGVSGAPREPVASAIGFINESDGYKVAVDIPTGVDPGTGEAYEPAVECDLTVTFHDLKPGLEMADDRYTGEIVTADIGIPSSAEKRSGPGDLILAMPPRETGSHKGQNGRVLVIGGGSQYAGAPALTGLASLNTGVDLATVAAPSNTADIINSFSPDLITRRLPGDNFMPEAVPVVTESLENVGSVIIGPGLGTSGETTEAIFDLLREIAEDHPELPVLLDADGLKIASEQPDLLRELKTVVTPHSGEFRYLYESDLPDDYENKAEVVSEVSRDIDSTIILKGHIDICADSGGRTVFNDTGNPGMTVGGTGDVLAGVTGAFLSQGAEPFWAASAGVFLNGLSGDICEEEKGYQFTATDVKDKIPLAISRTKEYW